MTASTNGREGRRGLGAMPLQTQLLITMVTLAMIPLVLAVWLGLNTASQALTSLSESEIRGALTSLRSYLENATVTVAQDALIVANSAETSVINPPAGTNKQSLLSGLNAVWGYQEVSVFDDKGAFVSGTRGSPPARPVLDSEWFQSAAKLQAGQVFFSDAEAATVGGQPFFNVAAPIYSAQRQLIGVVRVAWDPTPLLRAMRSAVNEDKGLDMISKKGQRFASTKSGLGIVDESTREPYIRNQTAPEGLLTYTYAGQPVTSAFTRINPPLNIKGLDWTLVLESNRDVTQAPVVWLRNILFGLGALLLIAVAIASFLLSRRLARPVNQLAALTDRVQRERDGMQQQIATLLDEVSTVAEGDLTVQAQVTADTLGSVADAFNYMVEELRSIINNVNRTTIEVASSTRQITANANEQATQTEHQSSRIVEVTSAVDEMAQVAQSVAVNAATGAEIAASARRNAGEGAEAARQTMEGMNRIRGEVQETSKKIKRLGESSQEIGQIVQLIEDIADQTNLLALNAAIQAAMAGEHGRGFAVVADEVRRLAERAGVATKQIAGLVKSIQGDTAEAVLAMENSTREVVEGSRLADSAGQRLGAINEVVAQLSALIEEIAQAAKRQASASDEVKVAMSEISETTRAATTNSRQAVQSVDYLAQMAEQLRASVATFRLEKTEAIQTDASRTEAIRLEQPEADEARTRVKSAA